MGLRALLTPGRVAESFSAGVLPPSAREALKVVGTLPVAQRRGRRLEIVEGSMAPEFFVIDSMAALDLAILLRASRPDVSMADPRFLDRKREG
jgi:hypothetical protein